MKRDTNVFLQFLCELANVRVHVYTWALLALSIALAPDDVCLPTRLLTMLHEQWAAMVDFPEGLRHLWRNNPQCLYSATDRMENVLHLAAHEDNLEVGFVL